jgi:hypothetical protein
MNEQVMYWLAAASNRPQISDPMMRIVESGGIGGGIWMLHNYWKIAWFEGRQEELSKVLLPQLISELKGTLGETENSTSLKLIGGTYHVVGCSSPEYNCYPPFQDRMCHTKQDCNYEIAQLRWGLTTVLDMIKADPTLAQSPCGTQDPCAVDFAWWHKLITGALTWYPYDDVTGFRLDVNCAFECPHRHFSHLLQMYDLETVEHKPVAQGGNSSVNDLMLKSLDNWFRVTCNDSNVFNEECRGFTQCGMSAMSAVTDRADAAVGNLTGLIDTVITPNGMYGEMVPAPGNISENG